MAARQSAATERALARVAKGETPYAAARAEGISMSTIYRAQGTDYAYQVGAVFAAICAKHGNNITAVAAGNIATRPDLMMRYVRHLDLSEFQIPDRPEHWRADGRTSGRFWLGYYHSRQLQQP